MADTHVIRESTGGDSSFGFFMGMILLIVFLFLLFFYGLPAIRNMGTGGNQQNVTIPDSGNQTPNIQVPDKVDINVNK